MGQYEVYEWLRNARSSGNEQYFSSKEIEDGLKNNGCTDGQLSHTRGDVIRLYVSGYLELIDLDKTGLTNYKRFFRIKKRYCNNGKQKL
jgi:hypothetical protein